MVSGDPLLVGCHPNRHLLSDFLQQIQDQPQLFRVAILIEAFPRGVESLISSGIITSVLNARIKGVSLVRIFYVVL